MFLEYEPPALKKHYEDERWLKKHYNKEISLGMLKFISAACAAKNAYDIKCLPQFYMEHKKGNLKKFYSISLDKKKSKWRLLIQLIDNDGNIATPSNNEIEFLKKIEKIKIGRLSEHYGEY